jgi:hypothetical protein
MGGGIMGRYENLRAEVENLLKNTKEEITMMKKMLSNEKISLDGELIKMTRINALDDFKYELELILKEDKVANKHNQEKFDKMVDEIREDIAATIKRFKGKQLTEDLQQEIYAALGVDLVVFYDNFGNSDYTESGYLEHYEEHNEKLIIEGTAVLVDEHQGLVYWSTMDNLIVDVKCRVEEM